MSNGAGQISTSSESQVGAIRRSSISVKEAVDHARAINGRLSGIKTRVMGMNNDKVAEEDVPEPQRSDLEELDHQISILHGEMNLIGNHIDDVNTI